MASGLGTPIASALAATLCETVTVASPGTQISTLGRRVSVRVAASDASNATLTYRATGLPAGLSIDMATGDIEGTPTQAGTSTVAVEATDTSGRTSTTAFTWTIRYATVLSVSPSTARCGVTLRRRAVHQAGALRLTGSLRGGSVAVADARGAVVTVKLVGTTVTVTAGRKLLATVIAATGGLHEVSRSATALELASGDRHFRLFVTSSGSVVTAKGQACSYYAARSQRLTSTRGALYLVSTNGARVTGAPISITDGKRTFTVRTGRSGAASFTVSKGPSRSISAAYAGGSRFGPATVTIQVRHHR
jgi:hypothetical protein